MGLDVYLYERAEQEASDAHNTAWEAWYARFGERSEDDPAVAQSKLEHEMSILGHEADCSECVHTAIPADASSSDVPSERYPGHLCNRRYLRSSYNASGFNRAVPDFLADSNATFNGIFEPVRGTSDDYSIELTDASIPGLEQAKDKALSVASRLATCDSLRVMDATAMIGSPEHLWGDLPTDEQVLAWYREEKAGSADRAWLADGGYSTAKGAVLGFDKGQEVFAMTLGKDVLGRPCAMAVYRGDVSSYMESAEIVAEFCDEAVMLIRRDGAVFMHWSG
ncbi:hypothetical protein [Kribbella sp. NPDC051718]|uniref:hypothetical protein n=1 Tax=Kribbella sp. NPDC051718 TaxID=3155168 RepID=UPI003440EA52